MFLIVHCKCTLVQILRIFHILTGYPSTSVSPPSTQKPQSSENNRKQPKYIASTSNFAETQHPTSKVFHLLNSISPDIFANLITFLSAMNNVTNATDTFSVSSDAPPWWGKGVGVFLDAIAQQSDYAESNGISWDRFGALSAYICSLYGLSTMLVALVLNRTAVIASTNSTRRQARFQRPGLLGQISRLEWPRILAVVLMRTLAVFVLLYSVFNVLVGLKVLDQGPENLSYLTRMIPDYFQYDPEVFAGSKYMKMPRSEVRFGPTSDMFWPVFLSVCYLLFVETFSSAISGKKPFLEGGISLFELSLALQEVSSGFFFLREYHIAKRPSEQVLIVCLFSLLDHIQGHVGGLANGNKYRLVPLTVLNVGFLWYFVLCTVAGSILLFPFTIIVTYSCLVCVLGVIVVCSVIFVLAILAKGQRLHELNYGSYLSSDEGSEFFSRNLGCSFRDDFYTASINIGLFAITLAGKSSYITEYNYVLGKQNTWLEEGLWQKVQSVFNVSSVTLLSEAVQSGKLLAYLKENRITGYGNVVVTPSPRLISSKSNEKRSGSTIKNRTMHIKELSVRLYQLVESLVVESFALYFVPRAFRKFILRQDITLWKRENEAETDEEFRARRARAPPFIRNSMTQREKREAPFDLSAVTEEDLEISYGAILQDQDLTEIDESPDYADDTDDSDVESIDLTLGQVIGSNELLTELMTSDNLVELIESPEILNQHLHYDYSQNGMMTRSRYRASAPTQITDEPEAQVLLKLLLSKRRVDAPEDDDMEALDSRLACVICQFNTREIITWPCKCFAICESCRLSLVAKGIEGCVCCRRDVEGVSKVYLP